MTSAIYTEYQNKVIDDNICLSFYLQQYIGTMSKINKYILYSMELCLKNKEMYPVLHGTMSEK
jgi:hypothetical protein